METDRRPSNNRDDARDPSALATRLRAGAVLERLAAESEALHLMLLDRDGAIQAVNPAFLRGLGRTEAEVIGALVWDFLTEDDVASLRGLLTQPEHPDRAPRLLNFVDTEQHPFTIQCRLDVGPDDALLIGETPAASDAHVQNQLLQVSNELSVLYRENMRKTRELEETKARLEKTLEDLNASSWHLKKIQEFIPICYACHKVRIPDAHRDGAEVWTDLMNYLSENAVDFSHGLCPECYETELARIESELRDLPKDPADDA